MNDETLIEELTPMRSLPQRLTPLCSRCPQRPVCAVSAVVEGSGETSSEVVVTRYPTGYRVVSEASPVTGLHVICQGLVAGLQSNDNGGEMGRLIATAGIVDLSDNVLEAPVHTVLAETLMPSAVAFVRFDRMRSQLASSREFASSLLRQACRENVEMEKQCHRLLTMSTAERVGAVLTDITMVLGQNRAKPVNLPVRLPRRILAGLVGTTLETISRVMGRLRQKGLVQASENGIVIPDLERLKAVAANGQ